MGELSFVRIISITVILPGLLLSGCAAYQEPINPVEEVPSQAIVSPTVTPEMTATPLGNFKFPAQSLVPTKEILIVYGQQEGDAAGDHFQDLMYVLNEPIVLVYTDGQVLIKRENWFIEEWLDAPQLCSFYDRLRLSIEAAELADRYSLSPTPEICISGCGGPSFFLRMAGGEEYLSHSAAIGEIRYLSREYRLPLEIIGGFANSPTNQRYISDRVAIWFEHVKRVSDAPNFEDFPLFWPEYPFTFLSLEPFIGDADAGFILFEGSSSLDLQHRFPNMPSMGLHRENDRDYVLILRPLLPHQGSEDLIDYISAPFPTSHGDFGLSCIQ
ncbi:MAG: hypothetical protein WBB65_07250 [Anaerolineales bacterium]